MVDTSCFYNEQEMKIHKKLNRNYLFRKYLKKKLDKKDIEEKIELKYQKYISNSTARIKTLKDKLYQKLKINTEVRILNENSLTDYKVISMFNSSLTRTLEIPINSLTTDIFIVQTYFFNVLKDIILNGFLYKGEKYIFFTASAGQIRTKKSVFIKESLYKQYQQTILCGLSTDDINNQGGVNINKYIAYTALCNSATDIWDNFDINKTIVVDDMETLVEGFVDYIDYETYKITRQMMKIPITHTDGCGMVLPRVSSKNMMVRLPWIKGLISPFAFDNFIKKANENIGFDFYGKVKDIYGKEWDLIEDGIEVIFVKSQFKMWKYYSSWDDYKEKFIKYNCQANKCNVEEDIIPDSPVSYQILQTLTDITYNELDKLCFKTKKDILNIGNNLKTMLQILGVTKSNTNKNYFQQAVEIYPELLSDNFTKEIFKDIKKSMVKKARSGKINIPNSKYTFIIPDLYAFCEYLILDDKNPKGLLENGQVYCSLYEGIDKLDCVRSPHLYKEHCIRNNVVDDLKKEWFITKGLYTSCHDLISKVMQFDVDGDTSLIFSNSDWVKIAERNMKDIVPLYYEMKTANKELINNQNIYDSLVLAYKGGNIGMISNDITKVWNSNNKNINLDVVKLLCLESNFTIDYAKTLYKPIRPTHIKKEIKKYTKDKLPYFFIYAKNKQRHQVEKRNKSTVNMLKDIIPNNKINFESIGLNNFNCKMLMYYDDVDINSDEAQLIINKYNELDLKKYFMFNRKDSEEKYTNIFYIYQLIKEKIYSINDNHKFIVDVLVKYLYKKKKTKYKTTLWSCFGDEIVDNIQRNIRIKLSEGYIQCEICNKLIKPKSNSQKYCKNCWREKQLEWQRKAWHNYKDKYRPAKVIENP